MANEFDSTLYLTLPTRSVAGTLGFARALLVAAPKKPSAAQEKALAKLHTCAVELQKAWSQPQNAPSRLALRAFDMALDSAWRALFDRLNAYATLPLEQVARAARAAELQELLFPTGLTFLTLAYSEEWAESERRLAMIAQGKLEKDLDTICGDEFLAQVKTAHDAYGEVLGITKAAASGASAMSLAAPLRALENAIASYTRRIVGDVDGDEPNTVAAAQAALRPYEGIRKPAKRAHPDESEPIDAPIPPFPAPTGED